nr:phosphoethanolamine--lipid A transferase [Pseudomonas insulae]
MAVALWLMLCTNLPFWRTVWDGVGGWGNGSLLFLLSLPVFVTLWIYVLLSLLAWGRWTKAILAGVLLVSAAASYFMHSYGIVIDSNMLDNLVQTDSAEATELLSWRLAAWMLVLGGLPVLLLSRVRVRQRSWKRELALKLASIFVALACLGGIAMSQYQPFASLVRNHREIRLMLVPSNLVGALNGYLREKLHKPHPLVVVGADAHRLLPAGAAAKPKLTILVVGETARAENYGLNGYARDTNPELTKENVISFTNVSSCGTATAISVPCMFLDVGRANYNDSLSEGREGLLDVLQRSGVAVQWRDNNSGCKKACDRVPSVDVSHLNDSTVCQAGECHDMALLSGLQDYLDTVDRDAVVVLHLKGSHGPDYAKRYPAGFEKFSPVCDTNQLDQCASETIVNAYDNTLVYTDHVLAQTIELLKHNAARFDTAMLYMSDHGESLGEHGIYLHGLPYSMAPEQQKHIPMILWLSPGLQQHQRITASCLERQRDTPLSHDNLFHSMLGLMNVQTSAYRADHDIFAQCFSPNLASAAKPLPDKALD